MSSDEFRDALAMRYLFTPKNIPSTCDGCGESFILCDALNCDDLNCDLCGLAGLNQIVSEPVILEGNGNDIKSLRADWSVRGFWDSQRTALFDTCISNADTDSFENQTLQSVFGDLD